MLIDNLYDAFTTPLHEDWKEQRLLRKRIPLQESWRGCVGLAFLLDRPDDTQYHGNCGLVHNSQLRWLILRDIPRGHFPGCVSLNKREVHLVNSTAAALRHGMPALDFRSDPYSTVDFRFMPFTHFQRAVNDNGNATVTTPGADTLDSGRFPREFAALNALSRKMTNFAFWALDRAGHPYRRAWAQRRERQSGRWYRPTSPTQWMPRPYLAFPLAAMDQLYWLATETQPQDTLFDCYNCRRKVLLHTLATSKLADIQMLEDGDFWATCPGCQMRHRWHLEDGQPCHCRRKFSEVFQHGFLKALDTGLTATAIGPEVYCGPARRGNGDSATIETKSFDLSPHHLVSEIDGRMRTVYLPTSARIIVKRGERLEAGQIWAEVTKRAPLNWARLPRAQRWSNLADVCGGPEWVGFMQQLWFNHRMIRLASAPTQVMIPADLVGPAVRAFSPVDLWWDMTPAMPYYDWESQAAALPPIVQSKWNALRFSLPGEVEIVGDVVDPRFSARAELPQRVNRPPVLKPPTPVIQDESVSLTIEHENQLERAYASCVA